ncbi:MAG: GNAT family N-acetyltransferase [Actinomycetota bacterium]
MTFAPLRTERLLLRPARTTDLDALIERRNEPEVAALQAWEVPYTRERAAQLFEGLLAMDGPQTDEWWMLTIADHGDTAVYGDLALRLTWDGRTAEIGYTLARAHWGQGYATEASAALIEHLFEHLGVHRIEATLHPANTASARVIERCGLLYEGRTRGSFWVGDEQTDDLLYGMLRNDWDVWRGRPRTPPDRVELVEITPDNARAVTRLRTHHSQQAFVSPVIDSFADALVPEVIDGAPVVPWYRAVQADEDLVGFVMVAEPTSHHPDPYLWRLLIDRLHQRRGIGTRVLDLVVDQCRSWNADALDTSWEEGHGSPAPLYLGYGFAPTGRIIDGETEGRLELA